MKLLFCGHCQDIVRLFAERRTCKCGRSWGHYLPDNSTTVQSDYSLSLGMANPDFYAALQLLMRDRSHFSPVLAFRAWFNPDSEPDVTYVAEKASSADPEADTAESVANAPLPQ